MVFDPCRKPSSSVHHSAGQFHSRRFVHPVNRPFNGRYRSVRCAPVQYTNFCALRRLHHCARCSQLRAHVRGAACDGDIESCDDRTHHRSPLAPANVSSRTQRSSTRTTKVCNHTAAEQPETEALRRIIEDELVGVINLFYDSTNGATDHTSGSLEVFQKSRETDETSKTNQAMTTNFQLSLRNHRSVHTTWATFSVRISPRGNRIQCYRRHVVSRYMNSMKAKM